MSTREIRRRCRTLVSALDIPSPFNIRQFCDSVAKRRRRRIELSPTAMPPGSPCGVWIATPQVDYIFYERDTSGIHQKHIVVHELGHILAGHGSGAALTTTASQLLLPDLDPELVSRVLHRTENYSVDQEREAETIASLILERAHQWSSTSDWEAPAHGAEVRRRLGETFEPTPRGRQQ